MTEDTYSDDGEKDVAAGVRTASEKSRQLSASSLASSRASGGAWVLTEVERWKKDFFTAGDKYL